MSKYLLSHGHLVLDGQREYLDGAILFEDNKILQIYPHSNKAVIDDDTEEINLNYQLVFPVSTYELGLKDCVIYRPNVKDSLKQLVKLSKGEEYVLIKDEGDLDTMLFVLRNIPRNKIILNSTNYQETLSRLHEGGISYSDLSLMICGNIAKACGQDSFMVKGNSVNLVIVDKEFNTIFEITDGEFIYD